jgi:hypothetical protein
MLVLLTLTIVVVLVFRSAVALLDLFSWSPHEVLKLRPEGLDGAEFVANLAQLVEYSRCCVGMLTYRNDAFQISI